MEVKAITVRATLIGLVWLGVAGHWLDYSTRRRPLELRIAENVQLDSVEMCLNLDGAVLEPPSVYGNAAEDYLVILRRHALYGGCDSSVADADALARATKKKSCDFGPLEGIITEPATYFGIPTSPRDPAWHVALLASIAENVVMPWAENELVRGRHEQALQWYSRALVIGYHLCLDTKSLYELKTGLHVQRKAADAMVGLVKDHPDLWKKIPGIVNYRSKVAIVASRLESQKMSFALSRRRVIDWWDLHKTYDLRYTEAAIRMAKESADVLLRLGAIQELGLAIAVAPQLRWELFRIKRSLGRLAESDENIYVRGAAVNALKKELYIPES